MLTAANRIAPLLLALACLFWAGNALVARGVVNETGPLGLSFFRWLAALLILAPFTPGIWSKLSGLKEHLWLLLALSVCSIVGYNTFLYLAALSSSALNIGLISASMPLMTLLLAWWWLKQKISARQWLAMFLAGIGVIWIVCQGSWQQLAGFEFSNGDLWMLLATLDWSIYSILLRKYQSQLQQMNLSTAELLMLLLIIGVPLLLPLWLWEWSLGQYDALFKASGISALFYVAIFPSILAYIFWIRGVALIGPAYSVMFIPLIPVFAAIGSWLWLDEYLHIWHWIGGGLILLGLFFTQESK